VVLCRECGSVCVCLRGSVCLGVGVCCSVRTLCDGVSSSVRRSVSSSE
jgi:hypothetical protein